MGALCGYKVKFPSDFTSIAVITNSKTHDTYELYVVLALHFVSKCLSELKQCRTTLT